MGSTNKICPHCGHENPKSRVLCINCTNRLVEEKKSTRVMNSIWGIAGGILLIVFDSGFNIGFVIPIPYALSLIGVISMLASLENLIINLERSPRTPDHELAFQTGGTRSTKGLELALIALSLLGLLWYGLATITGFHFGVLAIPIGWLIGRVSLKGTKGKPKILDQLASALLCVLILGLTEYFIARHFLVESYQELGYTNIKIFLPVESVAKLFSWLVEVDPISVIYWLLAIVLAYITAGDIHVMRGFLKLPLVTQKNDI